jgi:threonine dehydratase
LVGASAEILMPTHTPTKKVQGVQRYGTGGDIRAVLFGATYDDAEAEARRRAQATGRVFVSPYNDLSVIAGGGTIALEIIEALPQVERVIVCTGGGGLMSGIGAALKALKPSVQMIAACAQSAPAPYNALYGTQHPQVWDTLAEALSGDIEQGSITFDLMRAYVDQAVLVSETHIANAMRWMIGVQGWLAEGGGAVGIAAVHAGLIPADGRATVVVVSGGNVDSEVVARVLAGG